MTDIDQQVARFRAQLDTIAIAAPGELRAAANDLFRAIASAGTDSEASTAILQFAVEHQTDPAYRETIMRETMSMFGQYVAFEVNPYQVRTILQRFERCALACRVAPSPIGGE